MLNLALTLFFNRWRAWSFGPPTLDSSELRFDSTLKTWDEA